MWEKQHMKEFMTCSGVLLKALRNALSVSQQDSIRVAAAINQPSILSRYGPVNMCHRRACHV